MTELENRMPSLLTILPWAGAPGFPQDTAAGTQSSDAQTGARHGGGRAGRAEAARGEPA